MREGECFVPLPLAPNGSGSSTSATVAPSPGRPSAAEFTPERLLRPAAIAPSTGWRRLLYRATGGSLNPGISQGEARRNQLLARAKTPIAGCRRIAVISCKGGIGKTTTTLMLGHTFAIYRGDRVVALDANPDAGSSGTGCAGRRPRLWRICWRRPRARRGTPTSGAIRHRRPPGWR